VNGSYVLAQNSRFKPLYKYQISVESGLGDISAPGTMFPFGGSGSASFRFNKNVVGFRSSGFSELNIFGSENLYSYLSPFYGYAFQGKNLAFVPQASIGFCKIIRNDGQISTGAGMEISSSLNVHYRGLGFGFRPFLNINSVESYVGIVAHILTGWEWNPNKMKKD
jgi:hypothetical protein